MAQRVAEHQLDQFSFRGVAGQEATLHDAPVPQHRDPVGCPHDLVEVVTDKEHRRATGDEAVDLFVEFFEGILGEGSRGLVEDEHAEPCIVVFGPRRLQGAGDRHLGAVHRPE